MQGGISILLEPQNTGPDLWSLYLCSPVTLVRPGVVRAQGGICIDNTESRIGLVVWNALGLERWKRSPGWNLLRSTHLGMHLAPRICSCLTLVCDRRWRQCSHAQVGPDDLIWGILHNCSYLLVIVRIRVP